MTLESDDPPVGAEGSESHFDTQPKDAPHHTAPLEQWALWYAARGWPVHPLRARQKIPLTEHGCLDATTDSGQVTRWWSRWPSANVGLATGRAFDVLDLDGPEGELALDRWWIEHVDWAPDFNEMLLVGTPGDGQHWYLKPTGSGNGARIGGLAGVDWRGVGGYVVAPPSVHPNGGIYMWLNDPARSRLFAAPPPLARLVDRKKPVALADVLHDAISDLEARCAATDLQGRVGVALDPDRGDGTRYGLAALRKACDLIASAVQGTRNDTLNKEALGIYQLVAGGQILESLVDRWLTSAGVVSGLDELEVIRTLSSARRAGMQSPRWPDDRFVG